MTRFTSICAAILFAAGAQAIGGDSAHPSWKNLAENKTVTFSREPNEEDVKDEADATQLVDGALTSAAPIWYDRTDRLPVGWAGAEPIGITVDLGKVEPIRGVAIHAGAGKSGVAWPAQIKLYVSDDGETYAPLGDIMKLTPNPPAPDIYNVEWLEAEDLKTHGRFVKLVVTPTDSGNGVYFYADELEIFRGEDAWVSLPLPAAEKAAAKDSPKPDWENLAAGAPVAFEPQPNESSVADENDAKQIVDGAISSAQPIWSDKSIAGWIGASSVEFTVDLGKDQPIRGVALHLAAGQAGVEWPGSIDIYVSETGANFSPVGDLMQITAERPPETGYAAHWLVAEKLETHGRYVKFVIAPSSLGNGSYIFLDEVEVYRGEDAWLSRPLSQVSAPDKWSADWSKLAWKENLTSVPLPERPKRVLVIDGKTESDQSTPLQSVVSDATGVTFSLVGEAGKPRSMSWSAKLPELVSGANCKYVAVTFEATGMRRTYDGRPILTLRGVAGKGAGNEIALLDSNTPINDGLRHTVIRPLPSGFALQQLNASLLTEDDRASFVLRTLEFLPAMPGNFNTEISQGSKVAEGFLPVDLTASANGTLSQWFEQAIARYGAVQDGASDLPPGPLTVSGAPFVMGPADRNLLMMPESKPSTRRVMFLGHEVDEAFLDPVSRHDTLSVDLDAKAKEVLLLVATASPLTQRRGGIPPTALRLDDQESLMVELAYESGPNELAFPYSLADRSCYLPGRELAAYAVSADPTRKLRKVTLHNRHFGPAFALAGLTLNVSGQRLAPELDSIPAPVRTLVNAEPAQAPVSVAREGTRLKISNRWYDCSFDLSQGFVIEQFVNRWNPAAKYSLSPSSGLRVRVEDAIYTGRCFRAEIVRTTADGAEIKLVSLRPELPLEILVTLKADASEELQFVTQVTNRGGKPFAAELSLPALDGLSIGDHAETRLFFPQYRTVDTAEPIALRAPYGPEFAVQFFDVYNPRTGTGLMLRTDNPTQRMLDFALRKDGSGVSGGVHFPAYYNNLAPGETRAHPKISLFAHGGDWRRAVDLYTAWVRGWYKPVRSQDKPFFQDAWDLMCYRTSDRVSWADSRVPPVITKDRQKWQIEESLEYEKRRFGHVPDFIHFFNWTHNDRKAQNEYGIFGTPLAYEQVGGIEFFRKGIANIQEKWKVPVSLYTMHDRIRMSSVPDKELVAQLASTAHHKEMDANDQSNIVRASDSVDGIIFLEPGNDRWIDFVIKDLVKMQKDTGCKLVYIDVFPSFSHLKGYKGSSPRDADLKVIQRLRDALPADVVIWTEYPLTDVASQYADGCLQYYFMDVSQVFARRYNLPDTAPDLFTEMPINVQRFSTPTYRTFGLPTYIETGSKPSQVDAVFFNGEAFQEDTYRLHHSRIRERLNRGYDIKKEYTDCFNSPNPRPLVDTAARGIVANLFPGKNRQLWTFFNARPKTYAGTVIEVPHREGATYRDAWNGRPLSPAIENGLARIVLSIDPQQLGCVVQDWSGTGAEVAQSAPEKTKAGN